MAQRNLNPASVLMRPGHHKGMTLKQSLKGVINEDLEKTEALLRMNKKELERWLSG